jgi:hypothetical protein
MRFSNFEYEVPGMRFIKVFTLLLSAFSALTQAQTETDNPNYLASGFRFDQVDSVCVLPVSTAIQYQGKLLDTAPLRPLVMLALEARGYHVDDPSCSKSARVGFPSSVGARWLLTVAIEDLVVQSANRVPHLAPGEYRYYARVVDHAVLRASLFDTRSGHEVWRRHYTSSPGPDFQVSYWAGDPNFRFYFFQGQRYFRDSLGGVLAPFENRAHAEPPPDSARWAPLSMRADIFLASFVRNMAPGHNKACPGTLRWDSGTVSFKPDSSEAKCHKYEFSVARSEITYGFNSVVGSAINAFHLSVPGTGMINFCDASETEIYYFFAALGSGR